MATRFQVRPSTFLGIDDTTQAFFFDKAVFYFGVTVEADLEEHSKSRSSKRPDKPEVTAKKKETRLAVWLTAPDKEGKKQFRDPNVNLRG